MLERCGPQKLHMEFGRIRTFLYYVFKKRIGWNHQSPEKIQT